MPRASLRRSWGELAGLVEEVTQPRWLHPAWWSLVGAAACVERFGRRPPLPLEELYTTYLAADGGPHIDTFMARPSANGGSPASAVFRARAARAALEQADARGIGVGLGCHMVWARGWLEARPLEGGARHVAFVTRRGTFLADLEQEEPDIQDNIPDYLRLYPVLSLSVSVGF